MKDETVSLPMKERRKIQRIRFVEPLEGKVRSRRISILDLSVEGACIQHHLPLRSQDQIELEFQWKDDTVRITAIVTRCSLSHVTAGPKGRSIHNSGLHFRSMDEESRAALERLIDEFLQHSIAEGRELGGGSLPSNIGEMPLDVWLRNKLK